MPNLAEATAGWALLLLALAAAIPLASRLVPGFDPRGRVRCSLSRARAGRRRCALTFDDGPSPGTAAVLDVLREAKVPATFFVVARNAELHPALLRRAATEGHAIGVHGRTHRTLTFASQAEATAELRAALASLAELGVEVAPLYRAPKGRMPPAVLRAAGGLGLQAWAWTRGIWDTSRPPAATLVRRATRGARDGMVLLLHDGLDDAAAPDIGPLVTALPGVIAELRARRFEFVRLDDELT
jgi:peptidoglycan/xylan/chitin deacetylase (PgdA/CDA1 family)